MDVDARDAEDVPLLHWAAINDRKEVVTYLLKQVLCLHALPYSIVYDIDSLIVLCTFPQRLVVQCLYTTTVVVVVQVQKNSFNNYL